MTSVLPTAILGRTGLEVTRLGFGAMEIRGTRVWGGRPVTEDQAKSILHAVLDAGINFIDTSNDYGRSEEFIGRTLDPASPARVSAVGGLRQLPDPLLGAGTRARSVDQ
jgi:aryl-alcohol dehydrogenase-like predicted oxidoreductase